MSLIIALKTENSIVLTADKRAVYMDEIHSFNDNQLKVHRINDQVGILIAGDGDDAMPILSDILNSGLSGDVISITQEIENILLKELVKVASRAVFINAGMLTPPNFTVIIAGYTESQEQKIFTINSKNVLVKEKQDYWFEGVRGIAQNLLNNYSRQPLEDAQALAQRAIEDTAAQSYAVSSAHDSIVIAQP